MLLIRCAAISPASLNAVISPMTARAVNLRASAVLPCAIANAACSGIFAPRRPTVSRSMVARCRAASMGSIQLFPSALGINP